MVSSRDMFKNHVEVRPSHEQNLSSSYTFSLARAVERWMVVSPLRLGRVGEMIMAMEPGSCDIMAGAGKRSFLMIMAVVT
jgi:hypothetical protein